MKQAAIFIGVNNYRAPISSLRYAWQDAQALYRLFLDKYSQDDSVDLLYNENATLANIVRKIRAVTEQLNAGDSLLIYFSGHGTQDHGEHHLLATDSENLGGMWLSTLAMTQLDALTARPGVQRLFIIDSCRNVLQAGARAVGAESQARDVTFARLAQNVSVAGILPPAILCSCSGGEQAFEIQDIGHGAFTAAMLDLLRASQGGLDLGTFAAQAVPKVSAILKEYHLTGQQTPKLECVPGANMMIWNGTMPIPVPPPKPIQPVQTIQPIQPVGSPRPIANKSSRSNWAIWGVVAAAVLLLGVFWISQPKISEKEFTGTVMLPGNVPLELIKVEHGSFTMSKRDGKNDSDEKEHQATLTKDFYLGKYEVTQGQWQAVMGNNPSYFEKGDTYPVEKVSWNDAMDFCEKLNSQGYAPRGWKFTLPTETQWEYAAIGGKKTHGYKYSGSDSVSEVAWYVGNSGNSTHPVGTKIANELGFYDMSGNVYEWCLDDYKYDSNQAVSEFQRSNDRSGSDRVNRGGSWINSARGCRAAARANDLPGRGSYLGFRVALVKEK